MNDDVMYVLDGLYTFVYCMRQLPLGFKYRVSISIQVLRNHPTWMKETTQIYQVLTTIFVNRGIRNVSKYCAWLKIQSNFIKLSHQVISSSYYYIDWWHSISLVEYRNVICTLNLYFYKKL